MKYKIFKEFQLIWVLNLQNRTTKYEFGVQTIGSNSKRTTRNETKHVNKTEITRIVKVKRLVSNIGLR